MKNYRVFWEGNISGAFSISGARQALKARKKKRGGANEQKTALFLMPHGAGIHILVKEMNCRRWSQMAP